MKAHSYLFLSQNCLGLFYNGLWETKTLWIPNPGCYMFTNSMHLYIRLFQLYHRAIYQDYILCRRCSKPILRWCAVLFLCLVMSLIQFTQWLALEQLPPEFPGSSAKVNTNHHVHRRNHFLITDPTYKARNGSLICVLFYLDVLFYQV